MKRENPKTSPIKTNSEAIPDEVKAIIKKENTFLHEVLARIITEGQKDGSIKNLLQSCYGSSFPRGYTSIGRNSFLYK